MKKKNTTRGKLWWNNLTTEQRSSYIATKERTRSSNRRAVKPGTREIFPNGLVKIWWHTGLFSVYKPDMLDENGHPYKKWLPNEIK